MDRSATALLFALVLAAPAAPSVAAQPAREARLLVTVVDTTGGLIPGATVAVTGQDAGVATATASAATTDKGLAVIGNLAPGRYQIVAEFGGFDPRVLKDVRVRSGDNKHVVVLTLKKLEESVTVARDAVIAAADPRGGSLVTQLTREEIDALSDDPTEMLQQLIDMAGGTAVIKIDSFVGG